MNKIEVYEKLKQNFKNIRFNEVCSAAELFGFRFKGGKGSHRIYGWWVGKALSSKTVFKNY